MLCSPWKEQRAKTPGGACGPEIVGRQAAGADPATSTLTQLPPCPLPLTPLELEEAWGRGWMAPLLMAVSFPSHPMELEGMDGIDPDAHAATISTLAEMRRGGGGWSSLLPTSMKQNDWDVTGLDNCYIGTTRPGLKPGPSAPVCLDRIPTIKISVWSTRVYIRSLGI